MELITYKEFAKLRMKQFVPPETEIIEDDDCDTEWMGGFWIDEGVGITSVRRHEDTPDEAGGLEVDFSELPKSATSAIFDAIHLPLRAGMTLQQVEAALGNPESIDDFASDRKGYNFTVGSRYPYYVSVTFLDGVLINVVVIRKDVLSKCDA